MYMDFRRNMEDKLALSSGEEGAEEAVTAQLRKALMTRVFMGLDDVLLVERSDRHMEDMRAQGMLADEDYEHHVSRRMWARREYKEVQEEAERLEPGWGKQIWRMAHSLRQRISAMNEDEGMDSTGAVPGAMPKASKGASSVATQESGLRRRR